MLDVTFSPAEGDPALVAAADEYRRIWADDGDRVVASMERLSGLTFADTHLEATVIEGSSQSHPLRLRASYPADVKRAALVHELGHRLLAGQSRASRSLTRSADRSLEVHKALNLLLFDAWTDLYGLQFARNQVAIESARNAVYQDAWAWALALDQPARAAELRRRLRPFHRQRSDRLPP